MVLLGPTVRPSRAYTPRLRVPRIVTWFTAFMLWIWGVTIAASHHSQLLQSMHRSQLSNPSNQMPTTAPPRAPPLLLLIFTLSLFTIPPPSHSLSYTQFQTLYSLTHSLTTRVANLRDSRGDLAGSERARLIARKLESGISLGFWASAFSLGWDFVRNYAWRDAASFELLGVVSDMNELLNSLNELSQMESEAQRVEWVMHNYRGALRVTKSLFHRLLKLFSQSGPLREVVETVQKEVVEGDLLRDCLELGSNDLKGLIQVLKDMALQYSSSSGRSDL